MGDIAILEEWLQCPLILRPFGLRSVDGIMANLSWIHSEVLGMVEEVRSVLLSTVRMDWGDSLPVVPLTRDEVKELIRTKHEKDEKVIMRILSTLSSESTSTTVDLGISREFIKAALAGLRENHIAQTNLLNILAGTRFKYPFQGILVPTCCQHMVEGGECGKEDSFEHMVSCYSLVIPEGRGPECIEFLINMAIATLTGRLGGPKPLFLER